MLRKMHQDHDYATVGLFIVLSEYIRIIMSE